MTTNYEKVIKMTPKEIAELMECISTCNKCPVRNCLPGRPCGEAFEEWLLEEECVRLWMK